MASSPLLKNLIENDLTLIALEITRKGTAGIKRIEQETRVNLKTDTLTQDDIDKLREFELNYADYLLENAFSSNSSKGKSIDWNLNNIVSAILAIGVLLLMFFLFYHVMYLKEAINDEVKEVIIYILGVFSAIATQIFSFYFGSSSGSQAKTEALTGQIMKKEEDSLSKS